MNKLTYSYHTFYFPFVWSNGGETDFSVYMDKIRQKGWKETNQANNDYITSDENGNINVDEKFQLVQYFTPAAQRTLFGFGNDFAVSFEYCEADMAYHIEKDGEIYNLKLSNMKL